MCMTTLQPKNQAWSQHSQQYWTWQHTWPTHGRKLVVFFGYLSTCIDKYSYSGWQHGHMFEYRLRPFLYLIPTISRLPHCLGSEPVGSQMPTGYRWLFCMNSQNIAMTTVQPKRSDMTTHMTKTSLDMVWYEHLALAQVHRSRVDINTTKYGQHHYNQFATTFKYDQTSKHCQWWEEKEGSSDHFPPRLW